MWQLSTEQSLALECALKYGKHYLANFHTQDGLEYFFDELGLVSYQAIRSCPWYALPKLPRASGLRP